MWQGRCGVKSDSLCGWPPRAWHAAGTFARSFSFQEQGAINFWENGAGTEPWCWMGQIWSTRLAALHVEISTCVRCGCVFARVCMSAIGCPRHWSMHGGANLLAKLTCALRGESCQRDRPRVLAWNNHRRECHLERSTPAVRHGAGQHPFAPTPGQKP